MYIGITISGNSKVRPKFRTIGLDLWPQGGRAPVPSFCEGQVSPSVTFPGTQQVV